MEAAQPKPVLLAAEQSPTLSADSKTGADDLDNEAKLNALWNERMTIGANSSANVLTFGPGDLLLISVSSIEELRNQTVRVSEEGTVSLPLLGVINVQGMNEDQLRSELIHRVRKYMFHPRVQVFLKHTEHAQVAVLGAVKQPGRYMILSQTDSIMTLISRAGGENPGASSQIILIPAPEPAPDSRRGTATQVNDKLLADSSPPANSLQSLAYVAGDASTAGVQSSQAVSFAATADREVTLEMFQSRDERYREMLVRCGDVIIVPAAGEVTVEGWVDKAGAYSITPGLTVLGAIAAAGGARFTSSATLLRETKNGKLQMKLDLSELKHGRVKDVSVQSGDVVIVNRSALGAVPYSIYFLIHQFSFGLPLYF